MLQSLKSCHYGKNETPLFRAPRTGEKNGVAYNFVSKVQMEAAIDNDEFIEYATFAGNMYGTSKAAVKTVMEKGKSFCYDFFTKICCIFNFDISQTLLSSA